MTLNWIDKDPLGGNTVMTVGSDCILGDVPVPDGTIFSVDENNNYAMLKAAYGTSALYFFVFVFRTIPRKFPAVLPFFFCQRR